MIYNSNFEFVCILTLGCQTHAIYSGTCTTDMWIGDQANTVDHSKPILEL